MHVRGKTASEEIMRYTQAVGHIYRYHTPLSMIAASPWLFVPIVAYLSWLSDPQVNSPARGGGYTNIQQKTEHAHARQAQTWATTRSWQLALRSTWY